MADCWVCRGVYVGEPSEAVQCAGCGRSLPRVMLTALEDEIAELRAELAGREKP